MDHLNFHTSHCHDVSEELTIKFGLYLNSYGLFEDTSNWKEVVDYRNDEANGFGPVPWFLAKVKWVEPLPSLVEKSKCFPRSFYRLPGHSKRQWGRWGHPGNAWAGVQAKVAHMGLPHQNLQLCFQNLKALWQQQIFEISNASPVFTGTGGRCTKFGAEAL